MKNLVLFLVCILSIYTYIIIKVFVWLDLLCIMRDIHLFWITKYLSLVDIRISPLYFYSNISLKSIALVGVSGKDPPEYIINKLLFLHRKSQNMMSMKNTREQTFYALEMIAQRKYWITIKIERWDIYGKSYISSGKCPHLFIKHIWNENGSSHTYTQTLRYRNQVITQISNGFEFFHRKDLKIPKQNERYQKHMMYQFFKWAQEFHC